MKQVMIEDWGEGVAGFTLNNPQQLNAMTVQMARDFEAGIQELKQASWRAVVLKGAGRAFSAGGDLEMLEERLSQSEEANRRFMRRYYASFLSLLELPCPVVAAIRGPAIGAGLGLVCACDVRVASHDARLGVPFLRLGLHPGMGVSYFLPRLIGGRAGEWLLRARQHTAQEGYQAGLISAVVADHELEEEALRVARDLAKGSPESVGQCLISLRPPKEALEAMLDREAACQAANFLGEEFPRRLASLRERVRST